MTDHIEELAELYALGLTDAPEAEWVVQHASTCHECTQRLGRAEATVEAMTHLETLHPAPALIRHRPKRRLDYQAWILGMAALLLLAIGALAFTGMQNAAMHRALAQDDRALGRLAASQFSHAAFQRNVQSQTSGQVLYSKDGSWYYVVVMHPAAAMTVAYRHGGKLLPLGALHMHGDSGTLYLPVDHKMDDLALVDNGTVVADARLTY